MQADLHRVLQLGADDYLTKAFDAYELILRIQNILRRSSKSPPESPTAIVIGLPIFYPTELRLVSPTGSRSLTEKEAHLLHYFYTRQGQLACQARRDPAPVLGGS